MAKYALLVFTNPKESRDDEYNAWYDEVHLAEVLEVEGFVAARRYNAEMVEGTTFDHRYLAIYEMESDLSPKSLYQRLLSAGGGMKLSDALDLESARIQFFTLRS